MVAAQGPSGVDCQYLAMFLGESTGALRYVLSSALPAHTAISVPLKTARYLGFIGGLALQDQTVCSWWEVMSALLSIVETSRGCPCRDSKSLITTLVSSLILFLSSAHRQGVELQMCTMHRDLSCKPLLMITSRLSPGTPREVPQSNYCQVGGKSRRLGIQEQRHPLKLMGNKPGSSNSAVTGQADTSTP